MNSTMGKEPKYKLKKTLLHVDGFGMVNQANCTDEKAIAMLAISSGFLKHFEVYPDNWDKDVRKARDQKAKTIAARAKGREEAKEAAIIEEEAEELAAAPTPVEEVIEAQEETVPGYRDKLIALKGIAAPTADKIIEVFDTEAKLEAYIASGQDLEFSAQANKALLEFYGA